MAAVLNDHARSVSAELIFARERDSVVPLDACLVSEGFVNASGLLSLQHRSYVTSFSGPQQIRAYLLPSLPGAFISPVCSGIQHRITHHHVRAGIGFGQNLSISQCHWNWYVRCERCQILNIAGRKWGSSRTCAAVAQLNCSIGFIGRNTLQQLISL